ncbi:MAG: Na/Pi cotransporter family protein [Clostridia bacterium]|nr:Na/Pi cotransporter family protein [Clostridia bacterium]
MDFGNVLELILGLCLFLFGMNVMGEALERSAGNNLRQTLSRLTSKKSAGFLTGLGVTAVIQSSSATTVMVVGFVNSGLLSLRQAISVIMGANVGTTVTAWLLSLTGIESGAWYVTMFKPSSFTPILALIGIALQMFAKSGKKKDIGAVLLGFATLMFGMDTMSGAVAGLKSVPAFQQLFLMFENPILGVLVGAVLTAIIQSSSASVGILQSLAATGAVSYSAAVPIIMGQNIGTCVTAMISSVGTNKNARRTALVHLSFNIIGTVVCLVLFTLGNTFIGSIATFMSGTASAFGIAIAHTIFNVACTLILLPCAGLLEKLALKLIPDDKKPDEFSELDERLLVTPSLALERSHVLTCDMAVVSVGALKESLQALQGGYTPELAEHIRACEERSDHYEDVLGTYLVKLSTHPISEQESAESAMLLKIIGDFERISDHSVNILESVEELRNKELSFSESAMKELNVICSALDEILELSLAAFLDNDPTAAASIEPLESVIDRLKEQMRTRHILRLQQGGCTIDAGFVWSDLLTNIERTSDHCSNIAGCILDLSHRDMNIHESIRLLKADEENYKRVFNDYRAKYALAEMK